MQGERSSLKINNFFLFLWFFNVSQEPAWKVWNESGAGLMLCKWIVSVVALATGMNMDGPAVVHALANISIGWPTWRRERRETRNKNVIWIGDDAKMAKYFYPGLAIIWNRIYCCFAGRTESDEPASNTRTRPPILLDNTLCASPNQVLSFSKYLCVVH